MPALPQSGVTSADIRGHDPDMWDEVVTTPEDEFEILTVNPKEQSDE